MTKSINHIPENIILPKRECFMFFDKTRNGNIDIEIALFGGEIFGETHQGYIPYLAEKIDGFHQNIESHPLRYQGFINCLTKGLIPGGQKKGVIQLQENFEAFQRDIEMLYGYLGDFPEILERKGKAQNISVQKLLEVGARKVSEKRSKERGKLYTQRLLEILEGSGETLSPEQQSAIETAYQRGRSPKAQELEETGISAEIAKIIIENGDYRKIHALVSGEETLLGEHKGYTLLEMHSIEHLEKEGEITGHCVGNSDHYIRKMLDNKVRIFSLRKGKNRITLEYDIQQNRFIQMKGEHNRYIELEEFNIVLQILRQVGNFKNIRCNYTEINGLSEKENFLLGYEGDSQECSTTDYNPAQNIENIEIIGGQVICTSNMTQEQVDRLCELPIDLDITNLSPEIKNKIKKVNGNLKDFSKKDLKMNSLQSVGGGFDCNNAQSIEVNALQSVGGRLFCPSASRIEMNALHSVGGGFDCNNAQSIEVNALQSVGRGFYCDYAEKGDISSLKECKKVTLKKGSGVRLPEKYDFEIEYK